MSVLITFCCMMYLICSMQFHSSFVDPIIVMFSQTMYSVNEGAGPAQPALVLSRASSTDITVEVTNTNGSAFGE